MTTAILLDCYTTFFEHWGRFMLMRVQLLDGEERTYCQDLPTAGCPKPPGWSSTSQLTSVTAQDIIGAWGDYSENDVADRTAAEICEKYRGKKFAVEEIRNERGVRVGFLTPLDLDLPAAKVIEYAAEVTPDGEEVVRRVRFVDLHVKNPPADDPFAHQFLVLVPDQADGPVEHVRLQVPDQTDNTPLGWWFVALFTGVAGQRVLKGRKDDGTNPPLRDAVQLLAHALGPYPAPVLADGTIDLRLYRREVVRARFKQGTLPFLFPWRPDHDVRQARVLLTDCLGEELFRVDAEPGAQHGRPAQVKLIEGKIGIERLDFQKMKDRLKECIRFAKPGRPPIPRIPPHHIAETLLGAPDSAWPWLGGVVRMPTMRPDGSILDTLGYDLTTKLWYAPDFEIPPIPDEPSDDEFHEATRTIWIPFAEFPFVDQADKAATMACLIEQLVRPMVSSPRPLYLFDAPGQVGMGSGKTLLASALQAITLGRVPTSLSMGCREEEFEKRVTTLLMSGATFVVMDNIDRPLKSPALAQLLTSRYWQARRLGVNESPILAQNATWVGTLNGARVNRDIGRRSLLIRLNTGLRNPFRRSGFAIPNLIPWVLERRAALVRALLVIARRWVVDGRPPDPAVKMGSFESWVGVVPAIVHHAGFGSVAEASRTALARDTTAQDVAELVELWAASERYVQEPLTPAQLGRLARNAALFVEELRDCRGDTGLGRKTAALLKPYVDDKFGQYILRRPDNEKREQKPYHLERAP